MNIIESLKQIIGYTGNDYDAMFAIVAVIIVLYFIFTLFNILNSLFTRR